MCSTQRSPGRSRRPDFFRFSHPWLLAVVYFRVIPNIQRVVHAPERGVGAHNAVVHHGRAQLGVGADDGVAQDAVVNDGFVPDGHVGPDDGVRNLAAAPDADGWNNHGIRKLRVVAALQKLGAVEQAGVGFEQGFLAAAVEPVVHRAGRHRFIGAAR